MFKKILNKYGRLTTITLGIVLGVVLSLGAIVIAAELPPLSNFDTGKVLQATDLKSLAQAVADLKAQVAQIVTSPSGSQVNGSTCDCYLNAWPDANGDIQPNLSPFNGNQIIINGKVEHLPYEAIGFTTNGLAPNTVYHAYVVKEGGRLKLIPSMVEYGPTNDGTVVQRFNAAWAYVGTIKTNASSKLITQPHMQHMVSWFNREPLTLARQTQSSFQTSSAAWQIIPGSEISFLTTGYNHTAYVHGRVSASEMGADVETGIGLDSCRQILVGTGKVRIMNPNTPTNFSFAAQYGIPDLAANSTYNGDHKLYLCGRTTGGTATWEAGMSLNSEIKG